MTVNGVTIGGSLAGAPKPWRKAFSVRRAPSPQNPAISLTTDTVSYLHCRQRAPSDPRATVEIRMRAGTDGGFPNRHLARNLGLACNWISVFSFGLVRGGTIIFGGANFLAQR